MKATNLLKNMLCCGRWAAIKVDTDTLTPFQQVSAETEGK